MMVVGAGSLKLVVCVDRLLMSGDDCPVVSGAFYSRSRGGNGRVHFTAGVPGCHCLQTPCARGAGQGGGVKGCFHKAP